MATGKITKTAVDAMAPGSRDAFLWDTEVRGFGLKVTKAGSRVYILQYRMGGRGTTTQRYTIGKHGSPWTPESARTEAKRLLQRVDQGENPMAAYKEAQRISTELAFEAFASRFLEDYVRHEWRKSYGFAESILRLHVTPVLKGKPLPSITRADLVALLDKIPPEKPALRRNVYAVVRRLFRWAVGRGIERSPLEGFEAPSAAASRDRTLADWELRLAWIASGQLGYPFGPMCRLLTGTGQRRDEVSGLDWKELDRATARWVLPGERAKNGVANIIHLSKPMVAELDAIAGGDKWPRRGLVFTTTGKTPVSGYSRAKSRLDRLMLKIAAKEATEAGDDPTHVEIAPWRIHDFRRTMATGMQRLGIRFEVIEACENRISGTSKKGVAGTYQRHDWATEKMQAFDRWGAHVVGLIAGNPDNVVKLKRA